MNDDTQTMNKVELSAYDNHWYHPGAGRFKRLTWYFVNACIFDSWWIPVSSFKVLLLRQFGAHIGNNVVIKPRVNIKYPWLLKIGHHSWIGEGVWIDNLAMVVIGDNVCISQGAYLLTGNHNYTDRNFGLIVRDVTLENGSWVGARSIVCPGVTMGEAAVLAAGSILQKNACAYKIYQGNPAQPIRSRSIQ